MNREYEFDDMKSAIKRAFDEQKAPAELRKRVESRLMSSVLPVVGRPIRIGWAALTIGTVAAAAIVLVLLYRPAPSPTLRPGVSYTMQLENDLSRMHNQCCQKGAVHHLDKRPTELSKVGEVMRTHLGYNVFTPDLRHGSYDFVGANFTRVGNEASGHLTYRHRVTDRINLSVISLPAAFFAQFTGKPIAAHPDLYLTSTSNSAGAITNIVGWVDNDHQTYYYILADATDDTLVNLARSVLVALRGSDGGYQVSLAMPGRSSLVIEPVQPSADEL